MKKVYELFFNPNPIVDEEEESSPSVELEPELLHQLKIILDPHGVDPVNFLNNWAEGFSRAGQSAWAFILFRSKLPLAGHLAEIRKSRRNLYMLSYNNKRSPYPYIKQPEPMEFDAMIIRKKAVLRELALKSPLLLPVWEALKDKSPDVTWIVIPDPPAPEWMANEAQHNKERYLAAPGAKHYFPPDFTNMSDILALLLSSAIDNPGDDDENAITCYKQAADIEPEVAVLMLAMTYINQCRFTDAEPLVMEMHKNDPSCILKILICAKWYVEQERFSEANTLLDKALVLDPFAEEIYYAYANSYNKALRYKDHSEACRKYLDLVPNDPYILMCLGISLDEQNRIEEAAEIYRQGILNAPTVREFWNNYAICCSFLGRFEEAESAGQKALSMAPDNAQILDTLGCIRMRSGKYEESIEYFKKAMELKPDYPCSYKHLANTYACMGKTELSAQVTKYLHGMNANQFVCFSNTTAGQIFNSRPVKPNESA